MLSLRLLASLVVIVVLALAPDARSRPLVTDFATIRSSAQLVVIGTVHQTAGPNNSPILSVDVDKVIRGTAARGSMSVKESPDGTVTVGNQRVVAFIDMSGALRWVGILVAGATLETGVIQLQGFFDFNAHIVRPGIMTLVELQKLLTTGQIDQTFDATLAFRDGHGGFARSTRTLTVQYSPLSRALQMTGQTLACLTPSALSGLEWGGFDVHLDDTCTSNTPNAPSRSLVLSGKFTGVNATTGHIQVELVPTRPLLTEIEYAAFAADGAIATMTSVVAIALSDGTNWTWHVEEDLVDASGKTHTPGGVSMSTQLINGSNVSRDVYEFSGDVKIALNPGARTGSPGGNPRGIVTLVDSKTLLGCTLSQQGHPDRACTLTTRPSLVVRR